MMIQTIFEGLRWDGERRAHRVAILHHFFSHKNTALVRVQQLLHSQVSVLGNLLFFVASTRGGLGGGRGWFWKFWF
tara:strand:- start:220 stop:447 length:228 start_codon:yes stop_codon:yes gene_type:complete